MTLDEEEEEDEEEDEDGAASLAPSAAVVSTFSAGGTVVFIFSIFGLFALLEFTPLNSSNPFLPISSIITWTEGKRPMFSAASSEFSTNSRTVV